MNKAKKWKLNAFDVLIFVGVVAVVAVMFYYFNGRNTVTVSPANTKVTYKVEFQNILPEVKDSARVGDPVRDGVKKQNIGTITGVQVLNHTKVVGNSLTGEAVRVVVPDRYRVILTCEADAIVSGGSVSINGYELLVGNAIHLQSRNYSGSGYCIAIQYE